MASHLESHLDNRQASPQVNHLDNILLRGLLKVSIDGSDRWWLKPGASFGGGGLGDGGGGFGGGA